MYFVFFISIISAKIIIKYPELEKRSANDICKEYESNYLWSRKGKCYIPGTDCKYGTHSKDDLDMTTKRVNFFRQLSGLTKIPQSTNQQYINEVNQACLVMEKNGVYSINLSNPNLKCWSEAAKTGARYSNLCYFSDMACSADSILTYMENLGNRRWVLNPPLSQVVTSASEHYSALRVIRLENESTPSPTFLAYPPPGPVPADLIYSGWFFSRYYKSIYIDEHDFMPDDTKVTVKCNGVDKKITYKLDSSNGAMYPGAVTFNGGIVSPGSYCKVVISSDSADTEWQYTVQSINCENGIATDVNPDAFKEEGKEEGGGEEEEVVVIESEKVGIVDGKNSEDKKGLGAGAKAGISIAVILVVAVVVIAVVIIIKKRKESKYDDNDFKLLNV